MYQHNLDDDIYKTNIGECINRMYHERGILGAWIISHFSSIFSFSHYNLYKFIWAPLSLMYQQNSDADIYEITSGKFIYSMHHGIGTLGIWKQLRFCAYFSFFRTNFYQSIWAPLSLMHQQNLEFVIDKIHTLFKLGLL